MDKVLTRWEKIILITTSALVLLIAVTGLLGRFLQLPCIPILPLSTAATLFFLGLAFFALLKRLSFLLFIAAGIAALSSSAHAATDLSQLTLEVPCLLLSSLTLLLVQYRHNRFLIILAQIASALITGLASVALFGYITGLQEAFGWSGDREGSLLVMIALILIGADLFHYCLLFSLREKKFPCGPLIGTMTFTLSITLSLWQSVQAEHQKELSGFAESATNIPHFILLAGLLVGIFMSMTTILWQISYSRKRELEVAIATKNAILASSTFSIISTDREGVITSFNKAAEKLLQYKAEELIGKKTPVIFHDPKEMLQRAEELSEELQEKIPPGFPVFVALAQRGIPDEKEWTYIRKDQTRLPVELTITSLTNGQEESHGFVGFAADLTEKKQIEQMKNEMITITSHELRTPVSSIKAALDLLFAQSSLSADEQALFSICKSNTDKLLHLVNDLLDLQKMESGLMTYNKQEIDLQTILNESLRTNEPLAVAKKISLVQKPPRQEVKIMGDKDRLSQVLTNLLSNAIKYSKEGQTILIYLEPRDGKVRVSVEDKGSGIPKEAQSRIFQKFYRAEGDKTKEGTGLGLAIAKKIVEEHGGKMGFISHPQGSTFWFELQVIT